MKKNLSLLLFGLAISGFGHAQYRISLDSANTYRYDVAQWGPTYLIDVPFKEKIKNLYIDNSNGLIPVDVILQARRMIWHAVDTLIVLGKNNEAKDNIATGNEMLYEYILPQQGPMVKSKNRQARFLKYGQLQKNIERPDSILVYYSEGHGSFCSACDPTWDTKPGLEGYTKQFEDKYKLKTGKKYAKTTGFEGEGIVYLTLECLTAAQKIEFMRTRSYDLIINKKTKDMNPYPIIYMPFLIPGKYLREFN